MILARARSHAQLVKERAPLRTKKELVGVDHSTPFLDRGFTVVVVWMEPGREFPISLIFRATLINLLITFFSMGKIVKFTNHKYFLNPLISQTRD